MLIPITFAVMFSLRNGMTKKIGFLLLLSCSLILFGRGYQYIFWDTPIRALMWHQDWMEPLVNLFGVEWTDYASSPSVDKSLNLFSRFCGWVFMLSSIAIWWHHRFSKVVSILLKLCFGLLLFIFLLDFKDNWYRIGYFVEHAIQLFAPLIFLMFKRDELSFKTTYFIQVVTALTFIGHGLFAIAYYAMPGEFIDMIYYTLKMEETAAKELLYWVGILDIVFGMVLFVPLAGLKRISYLSLPIVVYLTLWGFLTAMARIYTGLAMSITTATIHEELYKFLYRIPHALYPLIILLVIIATRERKTQHS
jgi:hypothetical protein